MFLSCKGRQATRMRSKTTLISDYIQILLFLLCVCVFVCWFKGNGDFRKRSSCDLYGGRRSVCSRFPSRRH
ncbi:Uncharacterized protein APZ42_023428 [Daphnia magna]|uniref:Uncharacterized protein n=1 Tax=Daphnia magna TaxID=35525 RepID=A0A164UYR5_9CRUS|nr:Uncharacterized protein APZ42_023428 [Daphnia magna]